MKIGSVILGFAMICIGIVDLAGQAPVLGIHPAVWFILGVLLVCSDSAGQGWQKRKPTKIKGTIQKTMKTQRIRSSTRSGHALNAFIASHAAQSPSIKTWGKSHRGFSGDCLKIVRNLP